MDYPKPKHFLLMLLLSFSLATASSTLQQDFKQCMSTQHSVPPEILYDSNSKNFSKILEFSEQNPRWLNSTNLRPILIVTPSNGTEMKAAILCSRKLSLQIKVRSGGHDYEGLSYISKEAFVLVDLFNYRSIDINLTDETAWVQSGATLGELYYAIAKASRTHAFPAGFCPSVGVGGHFSGGGFGPMLRKHGLAADNILDAWLIDMEGRFLDRRAMGENLFWAIRGGGGANFGIILSWKIKLVRVPPVVTVFSISRKLEEGAGELVHRWQYIAHKLDEDLFIRALIQNVGQEIVMATFSSLFLGGIDKLIPLMNKSFPELGLQAKDCTEMSWIQSVVNLSGYSQGKPLEVLLDRVTNFKAFFKAKSDFVKVPIPKFGLEGAYQRFLGKDLLLGMIIMEPFGGRMNEIPASETPFPYRKGNLYNIQYLVKWDNNDAVTSQRHIDWIRMIHGYVTPFVSILPRAAYLNYRDLDLGANKETGKTSFWEASVWGNQYFGTNFKRLAEVKAEVDPDNFFRSEQSIPPLLPFLAEISGFVEHLYSMIS